MRSSDVLERGGKMYSIVITASTKSQKLFMVESPLLKAAKILYEHELGTLKDIHRELMNLPASFGPVVNKNDAELIVHLLVRAGVIAETRQFND